MVVQKWTNKIVGRVSSRGGGGEASPPKCPASPPKEKEKEREKGGERERKREREMGERWGEHIFGYYDICK